MNTIWNWSKPTKGQTLSRPAQEKRSDRAGIQGLMSGGRWRRLSRDPRRGDVADLEHALQIQDGVNRHLSCVPATLRVDLIDQCPHDWESAEAALSAVLKRITRTSAQSSSELQTKLDCYQRAVVVLGQEDPRVMALSQSLLSDLAIILSRGSLVSRGEVSLQASREMHTNGVLQGASPDLSSLE